MNRKGTMNLVPGQKVFVVESSGPQIRSYRIYNMTLEDIHLVSVHPEDGRSITINRSDILDIVFTSLEAAKVVYQKFCVAKIAEYSSKIAEIMSSPEFMTSLDVGSTIFMGTFDPDTLKVSMFEGEIVEDYPAYHEWRIQWRNERYAKRYEKDGPELFRSRADMNAGLRDKILQSRADSMGIYEKLLAELKD